MDKNIGGNRNFAEAIKVKFILNLQFFYKHDTALKLTLSWTEKSEKTKRKTKGKKTKQPFNQSHTQHHSCSNVLQSFQTQTPPPHSF